MLITNLKGGLGNQMFQYATARGISKKKEAIFLDLSTLDINNKDTEHFTSRKYQLNLFRKLKAKRASPYLLNLVKSSLFQYRLLRRFFKFVIVWQRENEFVMFPRHSVFTNLYLNGYFQSEKYFISIRRQLLKEFEFPPLDQINESIKNDMQQSKNAVSLHVRRGDYTKSTVIYDIHGVLPVTYYYQALKTLRKKYGKLEIFIFSDDIPWCKTSFRFEDDDVHFIIGNDNDDSWKDMALMTACRHHIVANSSFSWWGAWLSQSNGDTFAPDRWFNPNNVTFKISDFVPDHWHILNVA